MRSSIKDNLASALLAAVYLLATLRLVVGQLGATLLHTASHLLTAIPLALGATLLTLPLLRKREGGKTSRSHVIRLYLTFGILLEIIFGLYDYLSQHHPPGGP